MFLNCRKFQSRNSYKTKKVSLWKYPMSGQAPKPFINSKKIIPFPEPWHGTRLYLLIHVRVSSRAIRVYSVPLYIVEKCMAVKKQLTQTRLQEPGTGINAGSPRPSLKWAKWSSVESQPSNGIFQLRLSFWWKHLNIPWEETGQTCIH